jgi:hypothetical protein
MAAVMSAAPFAASGAAAAAPVVPQPHVVHIATTSSPTVTSLATASAAAASPAPNTRHRLAARAAETAGVTTMSSEDARDNAATMPVLADLGKVGAGIDPTQPLGWLHPDQEDR